MANSIDEYNDSDGSDESDDSEAFRQTESNSVYKKHSSMINMFVLTSQLHQI